MLKCTQGKLTIESGGGGGGGRQVKFYPYKKGRGAEKFLAILKGGCTKGFGVVFTQELEVLAILEGGGGKKFPLFKGGGGRGRKVLPGLEGAQKSLVLAHIIQ